jgi:hypothetical protein
LRHYQPHLLQPLEVVQQLEGLHKGEACTTTWAGKSLKAAWCGALCLNAS